MGTGDSGVLGFQNPALRGGRGQLGWDGMSADGGVKTSDDWDRSAQRLAALTPPAHPPGGLPGSLPA